MEYGIRLIYDKNTGKILNGTFSEMEGNVKEGLRPNKIDYLDLPFGYNDNNFKQAQKYRVDITKNKNTTELKNLIIIDEFMQYQETEKEKLRKENQELENQLLLQEDEKIGGIL
ncbi:hypothetical protein [Dethiothermospora halolimnae]|uniref:hypothetical protein n=1 Tax=Dethiothermospora halolimnae TaxID=3114390 RepID=UPI003CCC0C90